MEQVKCCGTCRKSIVCISSATGFYCEVDVNKDVKIFDIPCNEYDEFKSDSHDFIMNDLFDYMGYE